MRRHHPVAVTLAKPKTRRANLIRRNSQRNVRARELAFRLAALEELHELRVKIDAARAAMQERATKRRWPWSKRK